MRKFSEIYKDKVNEAEIQQENKVLEGFKKIYGAMLDHYGLTAINSLDEESQISFLTELNHYWSEEEGISEKGEKFLHNRSMILNENSTSIQKKNFLKNKAVAVINETLRQTNIKDKFYLVLDEMYKQIKASDISDVLSPNIISTIIQDSFLESINTLINDINKELSESVKPKRKYYVRIKSKN